MPENLHVTLVQKVEDPIYVVHVSDLHFDRIDSEKRIKFLAFLENLNPKPLLVAITGDIVDSPWRKRHFVSAIAFINTVSQHTRYIRLVPGNHDIQFRLSSKKLHKETRNASGVAYRAPFCEFIRTNGVSITLFALDSTDPIRLTRGKIGEEQLGLIRSWNVELNNTFKQDYSRSLKIVMLHHHPLPTKSNALDDYLYLKDAGKLLTELKSVGVDIVLHGHQHDPHDSELIYELGESQPITVLSAGTLLKDIYRENQLRQLIRKIGIPASPPPKPPTCLQTAFNLLSVGRDSLLYKRYHYSYEKASFIEYKTVPIRQIRPKYYYQEVHQTWNIDDALNNHVTRKITLRAWVGHQVDFLEEVIGSTVYCPTDQLNLQVRRDNRVVMVEGAVKEEVSSAGNHKKRFLIKLNPPVHTGIDDIITIQYCWVGDFAEDFNTGYLTGDYKEPEYLDRFKLTITGSRLKDCVIQDRLGRRSSRTAAHEWTYDSGGPLPPHAPLSYKVRT